MNVSLLLSILAGVILAVGFLGTFIPVLPGAPLAWVGLLLCYFSTYNELSLVWLIVTAVIAVVVSILDNIMPVYMTNKTGGSKAATRGATFGLKICLGCFSWLPSWSGHEDDSRSLFYLALCKIFLLVIL